MNVTMDSGVFAAADLGLLSPVRAGGAVEAAVGDVAWLQAMLDAEAALARAQARLGTVPTEAARTITGLARAELLDVRAIALAARETANPVVALVSAFTALVARRDASAAEYVHRGSTSQDVFDTGAMLVARRALLLVLDELDACAGALGRLAAEHRDTPLAGRTLALQAVPTTFGLKAAGWRHLVLDARARLARVVEHGLPVALGGAAGTLAGYLEYAAVDARMSDVEGYVRELVEAFADETGLAVPGLPWHALRTPVADLGAALGFAAGALGKFAVDVQLLARTETGEAAEPTPAGRGVSSAMPHKANPVLATLIRSAALQVPHLAAGLTQALVSEDERSAGAWHAEWQPLREALRLVGGAARCAVELAEGLRPDPRRMRANLELTDGALVTERLTAHLAGALGKATARAVLTEAATRARESGRPLVSVLSADERITAAGFTAERLAHLLDPAAYTGAAAALVDRSLAR
ncbi:3-carboxy-cis,cis-muconate cycloisomerase [Streptomyces alanosinicus]|uniref:3-carboxymuconate cycloisomerase (PcaB) n=1 Tax=Streptomyces alanosinicus TaxID=68171 RepID=A0A918YQF2_9ACTN|nr:3-carboxy-cis,cis-muconate cycloisomerase [Streptomyces alanosinicus]QGX86343.1 3-carboxy-cis,cis-muconate cycloisomerase [Streptomyces alanosinicus]GHE12657.1 putative 3-carboxymuconate cycloisomerase (PcaB) [Streptomyces alanosinicus]